MKQTLLQLTQDILSSMDADEVTSITDTIESEQVATIIKQVYFDIVHGQGLTEHWNLFNLSATDNTTPTVLIRPADVLEMAWFKYNKRKSADTTDIWEEVRWVDPKQFLEYVQSFDQTQTNVESFTLDGDNYQTTVYVENDRAPLFWTSFDDEHVVCDAYDSAVDTDNLVALKTSCYGKLLPTWDHSDGFIPDLDAEQFRLLFQESKATAWAEMKQTVHQKAEKKVRENKIHTARKKQDLPGGDSAWRNSLPNYGRR